MDKIRKSQSILTMNYYISKIIGSEFDQAIHLITKSLKDEGFGVISEIDI